MYSYLPFECSLSAAEISVILCDLCWLFFIMTLVNEYLLCLDSWLQYSRVMLKCFLYTFRDFPGYSSYSTPIFFQSDWLNEFWDSRTDCSDDYRFVYIGPKGSWYCIFLENCKWCHMIITFGDWWVLNNVVDRTFSFWWF